MQSLVAEVYGPDPAARQRLAGSMRAIFSRARRGWWTWAGPRKPRGRRSSSRGQGEGSAPRHLGRGRRPRPSASRSAVSPSGGCTCRASRRRRHRARPAPDGANASRGSPVAPTSGWRGQALVPLGELVTVESTVEDPSIHHKNLLPVVYVTGDVAGGAESPAYAILKMNKAIARLGEPVAVHDATQPSTDAHPAIKWDGEWHLTLELFRDLGAAFAVVLLLIYGLLVGWFRSFSTPLVVMAPSPSRWSASCRRTRPWARTSPRPRSSASWPGQESWCETPSSWSTSSRTDPPRAADRAGRRRRRRRPLPADVAHRAGGERWLRGDPLRPHLPGAGALARRRRGRLAPHQPDGGPGALHDGAQADVAGVEELHPGGSGTSIRKSDELPLTG